MPALTNPLDDLDDPTIQAARADPLVQYLVVRREVVHGLPLLLAAAAQAVVRADRQFRSDPRWAARVAAWRATSYRKVTTRSNERDWAKLVARFEVALGPLGGEEIVAALPPRARSETEAFLRGLQAYTLAATDLADGPLPEPEARPAVVIAVNPALSMSAGKTVAQVGHAALMCADAAEDLAAGPEWASAVEAWEEAGLPTVIARATPSGWARTMADLPCVVVSDGGLTEVERGTQTVLAVRPGSGDEVERALATLGGEG